ncbi:MAG: RNA polymerase sigma factor [Planctomycetota bacterium]|jgi:RNA polymerase sigma-70 factor (ECF subfamily)
MDNIALTELVTKASNGCQDSMGLLTEHFQDDLYRYIYRLTLNQSLTEDIRQETLLQMCKSIGTLRDVNNIKAWLFKTAWGKAMNHYRSTKKHRHMSIHDNNLVSALENRRIEGLKKLIGKEIAETLVQSISKLGAKQRSVLILRCYENLPYSEIASVMDCSETAARILFFRAKNTLKSKLHKKGIVSRSMLLGLLGLFGQVTSTTEAAVTVSAASFKVGTFAATIGYLMSRIGICLLALITGSAIVTGTVFDKTGSPQTFGGSADNEVKSFHFTKHAWKDAYIPTANLRMGRSLSKGAYEQWFFFPEGVEGPLFKMVQRWDPKVEDKLCSWLLNEKGQHYYYSGENIIYLMNNPLAKRNTARFPSDSQEFCDFLDSIEGKEEGLEYVRDEKTGLLMEIVDRRFANAKDFVSGVDRNTFNETEFGDFRYKWPEDAAFVDERDAIHKQGWTRYEISGDLNGQTVYGTCQIPFVYEMREAHAPLLKLHIGDQYTVIDSPDGAFVLDGDNKVMGSYPAGSFFKGLLRPWFGLHTIDSVRRDAAGSRVRFDVENFDHDGYLYQKKIVTLFQGPEHNNLKMSIHIDIDKNEIQRIEFTDGDNAPQGELNFMYPRDSESVVDPIEIPTVKKRWFSDKEPIGVQWLFELAKGTLGQQ